MLANNSNTEVTNTTSSTNSTNSEAGNGAIKAKNRTQAKLNQQQLREFADAGISEEYAQLNFRNVTKAKAAEFLDCQTLQDRLVKGTALQGGWSDYAGLALKPKKWRTWNGKDIKYESVKPPQLLEVLHPEGVIIERLPIYVVEGFKKAVSVAQRTRCTTVGFNGLTLGIHLVEDINRLQEQVQVRLILDNDKLISSINVARSLVRKLNPDIEIALFKGFKGIDEAFAAGVELGQIRWVKARDWSANYEGYVDGRNYTFKSDRFEFVDLPSDAGLVILHAEKGTGKTWYMSQLAQLRKDAGLNVLVSSHRINLGRSNAKRVGVPYIDDSDYPGCGSVALCVDSLQKINISSCIGAELQIDEVTQVVHHIIYSDTLKGKRGVIVAYLKEIISVILNTSGRLVVADADVDYKTIKFFSDLCDIPEEKLFTVRNTHTFEKGKVFWSRGVSTLTQNGKVCKRRTPADMVKLIGESAIKGERLLVCLSSKEEESKWSTSVICRYLELLGLSEDKVLRVDSETIGDPMSPAFNASSSINELCAKYQIVVTSPSLNTGIDIQFKGFDKVVCIATGVLSSNGVRQFLSRSRDWSVPRYLFAPNVKLTEPPLVIASGGEFSQYESAYKRALNCYADEFNSYFTDTFQIIEATKNYFVSANREDRADHYEYARRITQGLSLEGFEVEAVDNTDYCPPSEVVSILQTIESCSDDLTFNKRVRRSVSEPLTEEEYKKNCDNPHLTQEERDRMVAQNIRDQLGIEPTVEVQTALYNGKREQLEHYFAAFDGREISKALHQKSDYYAQKRPGKPEVASDFVRRSRRYLKIEALFAINFFEKILNPFTNDEALALIAELGRNLENRLLFNLPDSPKHAVKFLGDLAKTFNLVIAPVSRDRNTGARRHCAKPSGFVTQDGDLAPQIIEYWLEKRQKQVSDWERFKSDIGLAHRGAAMATMTELPNGLTDADKYTPLRVRAKILNKTYPLPVRPDIKQVTESNTDEFCTWLTSVRTSGVDIETYGCSLGFDKKGKPKQNKLGGLNHIRGHIRLITFATEADIWVVEQEMFGSLAVAIKAFLANSKQKKVFHNAQFDLRFLRNRFETLAYNCADTMLGSRCLLGDLGAAKITQHSLAQAADNFLGFSVDKSEQVSDWSAPRLSQEQIEYAATDAWVTFLLFQRLELLTKKPTLLLLPFPEETAYKNWNDENEFIYAAQQMETTGYAIDEQKLAEIKQTYINLFDKLNTAWIELCIPCKPTQKEQLKAYIHRKYSRKLTSLDRAESAKNTDISEIKLMQQIETIGDWLKIINHIEDQVKLIGFVKPVITILSGTGRTSHGGYTKIEPCIINLQSLPSPSRSHPAMEEFNLPHIKSVFKTDLIIDLSGSHGKYAAELSNDLTHIQGHMPGQEIHCKTAAAIAEAVLPERKLTEEWIAANKKTDSLAGNLRSSAKNFYYAFVNGAGVLRVQATIESNLQIKADKATCQKALENFQTVFARTIEYAKEVCSTLETNQFVINGCVCGYQLFADTYLCWRLGEVGGDIQIPATKAFAGIWSRCEALTLKRACVKIAKKFAETPEWKSAIQNFIHDEINCLIGHPDAAEFAHRTVSEEFAYYCPRTVVSLDPLKKCYPMTNWSEK